MSHLLFQVLQNQNNYEILRYLKNGPRFYTDIKNHVGMGGSEIAYYMRKLKSQNLIRHSKQQVKTDYEGLKPYELTALGMNILLITEKMEKELKFLEEIKA